MSHTYLFGKEKADGKSLLKAAGHELETLWVKGQQIVRTSPDIYYSY